MTNPNLVRAADALTYRLSDTDTMKFLFAGDDSSPDVMDQTLAPGEGPPLHSHPWVTWDVVVEGHVRFVLGDETIDAGPGDGVFTPPEVPHTFMAIGDGPARMVSMNWPGGFHRLYAEIDRSAKENGEVDPGEIAELGAPMGVQVLGPPLAVVSAPD